MIRPLTCLCMLLAGSSGMYLYQAKHRAQMLDRDIVRIGRQADQARERIFMLQAEWAQLQEPERLTELARRYLPLQKQQPSQFVSLAELAGRLPAPLPPGQPVFPEETAPEMSVPVVQSAPAAIVPQGRGPLMASATSRTQAPLPGTSPGAGTTASQTASQAAPASGPSTPASGAHVLLAAARPAAPAPRGRTAADVPLPASSNTSAAHLPPPVQRAASHPSAATHPATQLAAQSVTTAAPFLPPPVPPARGEYLPFPAARPVLASVVSVLATPAAGRQRVEWSRPPATAAEAVSRAARGERLDPTVPAVASALGMARSVLAAPVPVATANAASSLHLR